MILLPFALMTALTSLPAPRSNLKESLTLKALYSNPAAEEILGEPLIRVGIVQDKTQIRLRSAAPILIRYTTNGVRKESHIPAHTLTTLTAKTKADQSYRYHLIVERFPANALKKARDSIEKWRKRGFLNVTEQLRGKRIKSPQQTFDQRTRQILIPTESMAEARLFKKKLQKEYRINTQLRSETDSLPDGTIEIRTPQGHIASASNIVQISSAKGNLPIEVLGVEFGRGYAWHGHQNRSYKGKLVISIADQDTLNLTNILPIETMLRGILPAEIYANAHPQALEAQAIAARSHILANLGHKHGLDPYDICSAQHCQVFTGSGQEQTQSNAAIARTRGMLLSKDNKLINAVYSSTCGGFTEANHAVWAGPKQNALKAKADYPLRLKKKHHDVQQGLSESQVKHWVQSPARSYCAQSKYSKSEKLRWQRHFNQEALQNIISEAIPKLGEVLALQVSARGPGGRVSKMQIQGTTGVSTLYEPLAIRQLFKNLPSAAFYVQTTYDAKKRIKRVSFLGAGWGHGVGLCQLGAMGRAEQGQSHTEILRHYFNDAAIRTMY
ncbi:MAG: SpoIID/LytB domain-containing protein [Myxococcota bacterium]|jgi:SpoIID/LytB domain protein|nr:SpoIID/LytB domain-containing protein [Myxococcota bacterium]